VRYFDGAEWTARIAMGPLERTGSLRYVRQDPLPFAPSEMDRWLLAGFTRPEAKRYATRGLDIWQATSVRAQEQIDETLDVQRSQERGRSGINTHVGEALGSDAHTSHQRDRTPFTKHRTRIRTLRSARNARTAATVSLAILDQDFGLTDVLTTA
jgi:hypothetical protein